MRSAILVAIALVVAGCSSSTSHQPSATSPASSPGVDAVQHYLGQVNALCDALLPKVIAAQHGGHDGPYPVRTYFAEEPAHAKARDEFDAALAKIVPPAAAETQAAEFYAYLRFANQIDAARDKAAHQGQRAFDKQTVHERTVDLNSPIITAIEAAGFNESCTAR